MAVKSSSISAPKASAVFRRQQIDDIRAYVERGAAFVILVIDAIGTIVVCHGGWAPIVALDFSIAAIVGGLLLFGALTWLQCAYYHVKLISWPARGVNATLAALGYGPLFIDSLANWLLEHGVTAKWAALYDVSSSTALAWTGIWLVSLVIAWFPESRLIDE